jgi:hypothetical protein
MVPEEVGCGDMDWLALVQKRDGWHLLVNVEINLQVS